MNGFLGGLVVYFCRFGLSLWFVATMFGYGLSQWYALRAGILRTRWSHEKPLGNGFDGTANSTAWCMCAHCVVANVDCIVHCWCLCEEPDGVAMEWLCYTAYTDR